MGIINGVNLKDMPKDGAIRVERSWLYHCRCPKCGKVLHKSGKNSEPPLGPERAAEDHLHMEDWKNNYSENGGWICGDCFSLMAEGFAMPYGPQQILPEDRDQRAGIGLILVNCSAARYQDESELVWRRGRREKSGLHVRLRSIYGTAGEKRVSKGGRLTDRIIKSKIRTIRNLMEIPDLNAGHIMLNATLHLGGG